MPWPQATRRAWGKQPPLPIRRVAWQVSAEPLGPFAARLRPANLLLIDQPGGPPMGGVPGGGFPGGGFPGSGFPGDGRSGRGSAGSGIHGPQRGDDARTGAVFRQEQRASGGAPSPGDLDRQPVPAVEQNPSREAPDGARQGDAAGSVLSQGRHGYERPVPTEGFDVRRFSAAPDDPPGAIAETRPPPSAEAPPSPAPPAIVPARPEQAAETQKPPSGAGTSAPAPAQEDTRPREPTDAHPFAIAPRARALFGLAPAPFVEGDFVAALRLADGRWAVVQPVAEGFPNAWQRRVMLWFAIAFAIVAPVGWLFARHIVRPLARFTAAAEQLGRDPSAALVALEGPAEIGRAAHAFNVMQNRLRSFVDDRTAMVGAISHDLRTPLTRMRFRIEEVEDDAIREGMSGEVDEMEAMISSVLSFIRDASTPNVRERLDLGILVEDVAQDAAMVGGQVTVEAIAPAPVEVDVLGMRRLLANLVENAVKYGDRARIRLAIDADAAIAEICDDGPGVPEDELERAFEPFYRASNAAGSGKSGSGLGLAVCRSIARAHGGDVRLIRSPEGFAARLTLPLAYGTAPLAA